MPIYEYECLNCGITFEKRQRFSDPPLADCPNGHPETRRLLAAPAIVFKGSGFYINDSKADKTRANGSGKKSNDPENKAESSSESGAENKKGSKKEGSSESSGKNKKESSSKETS